MVIGIEIKCPSCRVACRPGNGSGKPLQCRKCRKAVEVLTFPASFRSHRQADHFLNPATEEDAVCYYRADQRAVAVCSQCGVFISEMYRVRKGDQDFCTHCFAKAAKNPKTADNANTSKAILHDVRAEYWTFLPFLFAWPLTVITGWVGLFIVIRYWKNPGGLLPRRSHLRMFITALFAVLEIIGASAFWLFVVLF